MALTKELVIAELRKVIDPEIHLDIYSLGLVYGVEISDGNVNITMTFTTPGCPYGPAMVEAIKSVLASAGATQVKVDVVFDPPWQPPEELKWALGAFSPWST